MQTCSGQEQATKATQENMHVLLRDGAVTVGVLQRGLAPRVFEYLFTEIDKAQDENVSSSALWGMLRGAAALTAAVEGDTPNSQTAGIMYVA